MRAVSGKQFCRLLESRGWRLTPDQSLGDVAHADAWRDDSRLRLDVAGC